MDSGLVLPYLFFLGSSKWSLFYISVFLNFADSRHPVPPGFVADAKLWTAIFFPGFSLASRIAASKLLDFVTGTANSSTGETAGKEWPYLAPGIPQSV